jgi:carbon starvation protein CstA
MAAGGPAYVVKEISTTLLGGGVGTVLAILGVIVLPITSGDTAFRSARLILAEFVGEPQKKAFNRLLIAVPLFAVGFMVSQNEFGVIWRYFGWANQTLAAIVLWTAAAYLIREAKFHWIATVPAVFMTAVTVTFLGYAEIGFGLPVNVATAIGVVAAIVALIAFFLGCKSGIRLAIAGKGSA